jgi:hypothetical protein
VPPSKKTKRPELPLSDEEKLEFSDLCHQLGQVQGRRYTMVEALREAYRDWRVKAIAQLEAAGRIQRGKRT